MIEGKKPTTMPKLQCQTCGGMAEVDRNLRGECPYCGALVRPVRVSSFSLITPAGMTQVRQAAEAGGDSLVLALCYLKAGNFTLAKKKQEKVIDRNAAKRIITMRWRSLTDGIIPRSR